MKKLKIVRIIDRMNIGGPAIHVVLLTAGLDSAKFETTLLVGEVGEAEGDMHYVATQYGVKPLYLSGFKRKITLFCDFLTLWKIVRVIQRERPDIVHTHKSKAGALGRVAAFLLRVPVVIHTFHGHVFHGYFGTGKSWIFIMLEKLLARFTDKIIVISHRQYWELCKKYRIAPPGKFAIIPLGFDFSPLALDRYRNSLRRQYNIGEHEITVGIVGRLTGVKNHAFFLKIAQQTLEKRQNVRFLAIGDGELREELTSRARYLKIEEKVIFTGWIKESARIYSDLDILALTSLNEGTPVAIIEAMFCKKPVVATDIGGVGDVVVDQKTGFLIKPNDAEGFCQALIALMDDPSKRAQMGQLAHECVCEKYSQTRLLKDMEMLYSELRPR